MKRLNGIELSAPPDDFPETTSGLLEEQSSRIFDYRLDYLLGMLVTRSGPDQRALLYRRMAKDPVIALGLAMLKAPIISQPWTAQGENLEANAFIESAFKNVWCDMVESSLLCLDYGYQPHEKIFERRDGRTVPKYLKPIPPWFVTPRRSNQAKDGQPEGTIVAWATMGASTELPSWKMFVPTYGDQYNMGLGESLLENVYAPWLAAEIVELLYGRYMELWAIPSVKGRAPKTFLQDKTDATKQISGQGYLWQVINTLRHGHAAVLPSSRDERGNLLWDIEPLMLQSSGALFDSFLARKDLLKLRGLLFPDNVLSQNREANGGDPSVSVELFFVLLDMVLRQVERAINNDLVRHTLVLNGFPADASRIKIMRLRPTARTSLLRNILAVVAEAENELPGGKVFKGKDAVDILKTLESIGVPTAALDKIRERVEQVLPNLIADRPGNPAKLPPQVEAPTPS